ncbi:hypothetical protein Hanom_Chr07g00662831 [Helianthus anomalus]
MFSVVVDGAVAGVLSGWSPVFVVAVVFSVAIEQDELRALICDLTGLILYTYPGVVNEMFEKLPSNLH